MTGSRGAPEAVVSADAEETAQRVAQRLLDHLAGLQSRGVAPHVVLTGGSLTRRLHALVADLASERDDLDWSRVSLWWGDERYVPSSDEDRNAGQAWADGLSRLPLDRDKVHEMPASDDGHPDVHAAAAAYAVELRRARAGVDDAEPWFHVLLLGIGPDGHCASLFPGRPEVLRDEVALGVEDSPKPPPLRVSLGMDVLRRAQEVWFVAAGAEKAAAVGRSFAGGDISETPSAGPRGRHRTVYFLDTEAAQELPDP